MYYDLGERETLAELSAMVEALTVNDLAGASAAVLQRSFTQFTEYSQWGSQGHTPGHFAGFTGRQKVLCIMGASNVSMFTDLFRGAFLPPMDFGPVSINRGSAIAAQQILADFYSVGNKGINDLVVVGHSYGGALAEIVAANYKSVFPPAKVQCLALGAPRIGGLSLGAAMDQIDLIRINNVADPIPRFPPHFNEAPVAMLALGFGATLSFNLYVQPGGGLVLLPTGQLIIQDLPTLNAPIQDVNLLTWLAGANGLASSEHSYKTYAARLALPDPTKPIAVVPNPPANLKGDVFPILQPGEFNMAFVQGPNAGLTGGQKVQSVYIPVFYRMKAVKLDQNWYVSWMDQIISRGQSRSNARTFAKYGNRFLRQIQTAFFVNSVQFGTALGLYLGVAGDPTTGFQPVLQVRAL
jgi:pimeloyl-ACP methyl ester carboxylesterase